LLQPPPVSIYLYISEKRFLENDIDHNSKKKRANHSGPPSSSLLSLPGL
jgi:hypothetical protein